jgi:DedD protein
MAADGLKQRLVGGATLLLVAVIAWFWLLSADSPVDTVARESQIPPAPEIKPFTVQEPVQPQGIASQESARESAPAMQSDAVPRPQPAERPQQIVSAAPAPKPAQAAPQKTPPSAAQQAQLAQAGTTHSAVGKSSAAAASAVATPAQQPSPQKTAPLKSSPPATKNGELAVAKPKAQETSPQAQESSSKAAQGTKPKAGESKLAAETFQLDQQGLPVAWVVQVGLFSTQASADKIKATLQAKGFKAYTESFKSEKASGIKVFVGPKLSRERADAQKKAIDELLKTNALVVRFVAS